MLHNTIYRLVGVIIVIQNYNSFNYWNSMVGRNKTIRGHMFMDSPPKNSSIYIHSLIFNKKNGIDNVFAYFPNPKVLLGYIQYSFLQEAFYKWINGKDNVITNIPSLTLERIIDDAVTNNKLNKEKACLMLSGYRTIKNMWALQNDRLVTELVEFAKGFNRIWYGSKDQFIYLKIMTSSEELGEFVIKSALLVGDESSFKSKVGIDFSEWRMICKEATSNTCIGERFKNILKKSLTEII